jgi:hypothetical protein
LATKPEERPERMRSLLLTADVADRFRKRHGKPHPIGGNGSLMSATSQVARANLPLSCDEDYCLALTIVIAEIVAWRRIPMELGHEFV